MRHRPQAKLRVQKKAWAIDIGESLLIRIATAAAAVHDDRTLIFDGTTNRIQEIIINFTITHKDSTKRTGASREALHSHGHHLLLSGPGKWPIQINCSTQNRPYFIVCFGLFHVVKSIDHSLADRELNSFLFKDTLRYWYTGKHANDLHAILCPLGNSKTTSLPWNQEDLQECHSKYPNLDNTLGL